MSAAVIAGALTLLAAGGTFAAFTDSDSETGTITAGTVKIEVTGSRGGGLSFTTGPTGCPDVLTPGDTCTETVKVENVGSISLNLSDPPTAAVTLVSHNSPEDGNSCDLGDWTAVAGNLDTTSLLAGGTATFTVTVGLIADPDNDCQADMATVTVTVDASNP